MIHANPATYDACAANTPFRALTVARPLPAPARAYARPGSSDDDSRRPAASRPSAVLELREDRELYIPDFLSELEDGHDPSLSEAARAETKPSIKAMALIDEACNLVSVLAGSLDQYEDSRSEQALTVLEIVRKKLDKAHVRIDGQEARHRTLFQAYATLKMCAGEDPEDLE